MGEIPEVFYFCLPVASMRKNQKIIAIPNHVITSSVPSSSSTKWSVDDH